MSKTLYFLIRYFCLRSLLIKSCPQTPSTNRLNDFDYLQIKSAGAYICPFDFRGLPQPQRKTDRETPTQEYIDTRKVCVEDARSSQHTTESIYYTPWQSPQHLFRLANSIVEVSNVKNKASVTPSNM